MTTIIFKEGILAIDEPYPLSGLPDPDLIRIYNDPAPYLYGERILMTVSLGDVDVLQSLSRYLVSPESVDRALYIEVKQNLSTNTDGKMAFFVAVTENSVYLYTLHGNEVSKRVFDYNAYFSVGPERESALALMSALWLPPHKTALLLANNRDAATTSIQYIMLPQQSLTSHIPSFQDSLMLSKLTTDEFNPSKMKQNLRDGTHYQNYGGG